MDRNGNPPDHWNQRLYDRETGRLVQDGLPQAVAMASQLWPTPNVPNGGRVLPEGTSPTGMTPDGKKRQVGLENAVRMWGTPTARDWKATGKQDAVGIQRNDKRGLLGEQAIASQHEPGKLNPDFVTALMGFPAGWLDLD